MLTHIKESIDMYNRRGFETCNLHADNEFECTRKDIAPVQLEVCAADRHVPEVERSVRTKKETIRSTVHGLPSQRVPRLMTKKVVQFANNCLNNFLRDDGVSKTMSPMLIVTGKPQVDYNTLQLEFGQYVQLRDKTNTTQACTFGAIALIPTGNDDGSYKFMSLATGELVTRGKECWDVLPMDENTISRVEALAKAEGQPLIQDSNLVVEWRPGQPVEEDEYDADYEPPKEKEDEEALNPEYVINHNELPPLEEPLEPEHANDDDELLLPEQPVPKVDESDSNEAVLEEEETDTEGEALDLEEEPVPEDVATDDEEQGAHDTDEEEGAHNADEEQGVDIADEEQGALEMDEEQGAPEVEEEQEANDDAEGQEPAPGIGVEENQGRQLRANRGQSYTHWFAHSMDNPANAQSYDGASFAQVYMGRTDAHETKNTELPRSGPPPIDPIPD